VGKRKSASFDVLGHLVSAAGYARLPRGMVLSCALARTASSQQKEKADCWVIVQVLTGRQNLDWAAMLG
jgi:hypothetical protein